MATKFLNSQAVLQHFFAVFCIVSKIELDRLSYFIVVNSP